MHTLSALHHHRTHTQFYQSQGGKQSTRTCTHNDCLRASFHVRIVRLHIFIVLGQFIHIHPHFQVHIDGALTGINAPLQHTNRLYRSCRQSLLFLQEMLNSLFAGSHFGQHPYLKFLCHKLNVNILRETFTARTFSLQSNDFFIAWANLPLIIFASQTPAACSLKIGVTQTDHTGVTHTAKVVQQRHEKRQGTESCDSAPCSFAFSRDDRVRTDDLCNVTAAL